MAQHVPGAARSGGPLMAFAPAIDKLRHRVVDRQEGVCPRCGERLADDVHLTMIRPVGKGGRIDAGNLVATHRLCNIEPDLAHTSLVPDCRCAFCDSCPTFNKGK